MKKSILGIAGMTLVLCLFYFIVLFILSFGHKKQPTEKIPNELSILEKDIRKETSSGDHTYINEILADEIKNCNAKLYIYVYINNNSLTKSKLHLDRYIASINKRVNERILKKECIDSLILEVSLSNEKVLKANNYRYSFPIK